MCKFCLALALNSSINTFLNKRAHFVKRQQSGNEFSLSHPAPPWMCINIYLFKYFIYNFSYLFTYLFFFCWDIFYYQSPKHTRSLSLSLFPLFSFISTSLMVKPPHCGWKILPTFSTPTCPARIFFILKRWQDRDRTPLILLQPTPSPSLIFRLHPTPLLSVIFTGLIE